jgi:hypothetical protein
VRLLFVLLRKHLDGAEHGNEEDYDHADEEPQVTPAGKVGAVPRDQHRHDEREGDEDEGDAGEPEPLRVRQAQQHGGNLPK